MEGKNDRSGQARGREMTKKGHHAPAGAGAGAGGTFVAKGNQGVRLGQVGRSPVAGCWLSVTRASWSCALGRAADGRHGLKRPARVQNRRGRSTCHFLNRSFRYRHFRRGTRPMCVDRGGPVILHGRVPRIEGEFRGKTTGRRDTGRL